MSAFIFVNRITKKCVVNTTHLQHFTLFAVVSSGFLHRYWSIAALSVAFTPLSIAVFLNFWKKQRQKQLEDQHFLLFIEKIILKMQNGNSFRSSIIEISDESDAFVQQNKSLLLYFVSFSTQNRFEGTKKQVLRFEELLSIDKKPHQALTQLKLLQRSLRLQIFFRRKSGQVSFQARFQSYFVVGIYFVILFLQIRVLSVQAVKMYFLISFPLILAGFCLTQFLGKKIKWKL
ncbi:MAG: hypothetical protein KDD37_06570 [Bdellovibrionales bacterium]|nr:hypothetical protein [Bdellovibrionales bacterium]